MAVPNQPIKSNHIKTAITNIKKGSLSKEQKIKVIQKANAMLKS